MKTTVDIPDKVLKEAMAHANAVTKRDAVLAALEEYNRKHRIARLARHLGTFKSFMTPAELQRSRKTD